MAKLNFSLDGRLIAEYPLNKERLTIGRRPSNDIHIDNLAVSGLHAVIVTIGNDSFLEDLNSTNGTTVNKKRIKKHLLKHADIVEFGHYQLQYLSKAQESARNITPEKNAKESHLSVESQALSTPKPALPQNKEETREAYLQILNGAQAGQTMPLNQSMVKLGVIGEQLALVTKRPHGYFLTHVEGAQRPAVNGSPLGALAYPLQQHDLVEVAGIKMEFNYV